MTETELYRALERGDRLRMAYVARPRSEPKKVWHLDAAGLEVSDELVLAGIKKRKIVGVGDGFNEIGGESQTYVLAGTVRRAPPRPMSERDLCSQLANAKDHSEKSELARHYLRSRGEHDAADAIARELDALISLDALIEENEELQEEVAGLEQENEKLKNQLKNPGSSAPPPPN
jgi:hypothetical protein